MNMDSLPLDILRSLSQLSVENDSSFFRVLRLALAAEGQTTLVVTVAGLGSDGPILCSRDVLISSDYSFEDALKKGPYDAVVLPGGLVGTKNLCTSSALGEFLKEQEEAGRIIAAICAAPLALKAHGIGVGKTITSYPTVREQMEEGGHYKYSEENVVFDDYLLTSRAGGTAFEFALALVEKLEGKLVRDTVGKALLVQ